MNFLPIVPPLSSARLGLRAALRSSDALLTSSAGCRNQCLPTSSSRALSTSTCSSPSLPCRGRAATQFQPSLRRPAPHARDALSLPAGRHVLPRIQSRSIFRFRAITDYNMLPKDYNDAEGLLFRKIDLDQSEVDRLFEGRLSVASANELLKIIHGRRVAGTLDDPSLQVNTARFASRDKIKALTYLREHVPADEVINAGLRAEDELKAIEEGQLGMDAEQPGQAEDAEAAQPESLRQPSQGSARATTSETQDTAAPPTGRLPSKPHDDSPYGESSFDRIRAQNIAKREAEEKRMEEERAEHMRQMELENQKLGPLSTETQKPSQMQAWAQKHADRAMSDLDAPPEMTIWQRLWPSLLLTICVCVGGAAVATAYSPPKTSDRLFPEVPPAAATVLALLGLNLAAYVAWKLPPCWSWCTKYLLVVPATPRAWSLIGASFSHSDIPHLLGNAMLIWFFGTRLHDEIGRGNLVALYMACGTVGFMGSLTSLVVKGWFHATTRGASGAALGLMVAYFWGHRFDEFRFFGYPPENIQAPQGLAFIAILAGLHVWQLFRKGQTDTLSHIWGMVAGGAGMELIQRRKASRERIRAERMKALGMSDAAGMASSGPAPGTKGWWTVHPATVRER